MITKETCVKIWQAYNEIENAQKLLQDMAEILKKDHEKSPNLYNAFGERRGLQLGVPSGSDSHRLYNVSPTLSVAIIEEHIEINKKKLEELKAIAKIELYGKEVENERP